MALCWIPGDAIVPKSGWSIEISPWYSPSLPLAITTFVPTDTALSIVSATFLSFKLYVLTVPLGFPRLIFIAAALK